MAIRKYLPYGIYKRLMGDRESFGLQTDIEDPDWKIWKQKSISDFYENMQTSGIGNWVCNLVYPVVSNMNFHSKAVLEIGPGKIRHLRYITSMPLKYVICDIEEKFLTISKHILDEAKIPNEKVLIDVDKTAFLPFPNESFDVIISFNSLEHLHPLDEYLVEMKNKLKHGGIVVGGIPCEGGFVWGLGRFLTTRRYVQKNYGINYDKIICWEHPNFADHIIKRLNFYFEREYLKLHPFSTLSMDFNLMASFIYRKD